MDTVRVCVNEALKAGSLPDSLKCANVRPIYKKEDPFDKRNYRPVNILQVCGRMLYEQASNYFEPFFNENLRVDLGKHVVRNMLYLINFMAKFVR